MRETLSINENLLTGESTVKTKYKKENGTKGIITVEMFDKDNNLVNKTRTENMILNGIDKVLMYNYYKAILTGTSTIKAYQTPFEQLQLRYAPTAEAEKYSLFPSGKLVGLVNGLNTTNSANSLVGIAIPDLCSTEVKDGYYIRKRTYEFGIPKANGTIDTLCYMQQGNAETGYVNQMYHIKDLTTIPYGYFDVNGNLYKRTNNTAYTGRKVLNLEAVLFAEATPVFESEDSEFVPAGNRIDSNRYIKNFLYSSKNAAASANRSALITFDVVNEAEDTVEQVSIDLMQSEAFNEINAALDKAKSSTSVIRYTTLLGCQGEDIIFYAQPHTSSSALVFPAKPTKPGAEVLEDKEYYANMIFFYNLSTKTIRPIDIREYYTREAFGITGSNYNSGECRLSPIIKDAFIDNYNGMIINSKLVKFNKDEVTDFSYEGLTNGSIYSVCAKNTELMLYSDSKAPKLGAFMPVCSITKLPIPIEKDDSSSMKVTYELHFQMPKMYAPIDEAFNWEDNNIYNINPVATLEEMSDDDIMF